DQGRVFVSGGTTSPNFPATRRGLPAPPRAAWTLRGPHQRPGPGVRERRHHQPQLPGHPPGPTCAPQGGVDA
ncbi:hypothetical protein, partial [Hymenobacter coccineus]|uniref:hypothetical protein n=1 Tax=Hymenobacter coccineus TaxID=1908235 RepID=UPI0019557E88